MQTKLNQEIKQALGPKKAQVKRPAKGAIKHDYLVPGGPYEEQWDWDGFFVGVSLASEISSEAVYLKNWALNYLHRVRPNGFVSGLITPDGIDRRLRHIKPFLAQGCYLSSHLLKDNYTWIKPHWNNLKKTVAYRAEKCVGDNHKNLTCWHNSMESGADNNIAALGFRNGSIAGADLNTFLCREYMALAKIAKQLKKNGEEKKFRAAAERLKDAILQDLWDGHDSIFYNLDTVNGKLIKHVSYSSIVPLWAGIISQKDAEKMIKKYILNPKKLWSPYGIRSLSADDSQYNNTNIIKPYSNWQGPIWPLVNYLTMHALLRYGFSKEANQVAVRTTRMVLADLKKTGGMHENYHAETGKPLAAPDFISWNLLVGQMIEQAETGYNPFDL